MKKLIIILSIILSSPLVFSQNTNISGTINSYQSVSNISGNIITIPSSAAYTIGDKILIIQMKGAEIDETNNATFGDIVNLNSAGNYEILRICDIPSSTEISVTTPQGVYDPNSSVQIVNVPVYQDATITSTLTALPWNGTTGGILIFECTGNLTLNNGIDLQGAGFNGGQITTSTFSCQWYASSPDYFYDISSGEGANKGEGVASFIPNKTSGRGAQANGGGGGNDHNSGGGGGANAGDGGSGGERIPSSTFTCSGPNPGIGGKANNYSTIENRIFLGGGGGSGHENNAGTGSDGSDGGGMVIIIADTIFGNSQLISVDGDVVQDGEDGAGGGGAGGTVLLDFNAFQGNLTVNANGANGGDVPNIGSSNCNGPGGGGGGGILWTSGSAVPPGITFNSNGGLKGVTTSATQGNCTVGGSNNAQDGNPGMSLTNLNIQPPVEAEGIDVIVACDSLNWIDGNTYFTDNNSASHLILGGAQSGCDSTVNLDLSIVQIDTTVFQTSFFLVSNHSTGNIQWYSSNSATSDCFGQGVLLSGETNDSLESVNYGAAFYFAIIEENGCIDTTACFYQDLGEVEKMQANDLLIYPNPTTGQVTIDFNSVLAEVSLFVTDISGRQIMSTHLKDVHTHNLSMDYEPGTYFLQVKIENSLRTIPIILN